MELEERKKTYDKATKLYGHQKQLFQLVEECAEIIKEVNKLNRTVNLREPEIIQHVFNDKYGNKLDNLCEELADLEIMIEQTKNMSDSGLIRSKIDFHKNIKLERFKESLENYEKLFNEYDTEPVIIDYISLITES